MARSIRGQDLLTLLTALGFVLVGGLGLAGVIPLGSRFRFWFQMALLVIVIVFAFLSGMKYVEYTNQENSEARRT